ncbi:DnaT-like ssDNA-binding protein [Phenylobacterium conjunctum]|uniref:DnaT-like ssDNA-binding protein n=1 Tax=Phenylobacterium conjunctum TaxID=1298959 RepID=A0ABW3SY00_9CAUL
MALIVEDGSMVAGAESYCSVTAADTYHSDSGNTAWAALATAAKEQALRKATRYMLGAYRHRWAGTRKTTTQALDWPRYMVPIRDTPTFQGTNLAYVSATIVPTEVIQACADLALTNVTGGALASDLTSRVLREKVGEIEVEYDRGSPQFTVYRSIDMMLRPYLKSGGNGIVGLTR